MMYIHSAFFKVLLGIEPMALYILGKCYTCELYSKTYFLFTAHFLICKEVHHLSLVYFSVRSMTFLCNTYIILLYPCYHSQYKMFIGETEHFKMIFELICRPAVLEGLPS